MSMYASYVRERLGDEILEREEGFLTYRYLEDMGEKCVYIVDIFVRPDFRKSKVASDMADTVVERAKKEGCKRLLGSVSFDAKNVTDSIKVLFGYGMEFYRGNQAGMFFKKEI